MSSHFFFVSLSHRGSWKRQEERIQRTGCSRDEREKEIPEGKQGGRGGFSLAVICHSSCKVPEMLKEKQGRNDLGDRLHYNLAKLSPLPLRSWNCLTKSAGLINLLAGCFEQFRCWFHRAICLRQGWQHNKLLLTKQQSDQSSLLVDIKLQWLSWYDFLKCDTDPGRGSISILYWLTFLMSWIL